MPSFFSTVIRATETPRACAICPCVGFMLVKGGLVNRLKRLKLFPFFPRGGQATGGILGQKEITLGGFSVFFQIVAFFFIFSVTFCPIILPIFRHRFHTHPVQQARTNQTGSV